MLSWWSKLSQLVCWLAALCILLIVTLQNNAYSYSYDAHISVSNQANVAFEDQNQQYDGTSNLCSCGISSPNKNLQEKAQDGPFFVFEVSLVATKGISYSPLNPGPLIDDVAKTFRSSTYTQRALSSDTTLYRVISNNGNPAGGYWTRVKPKGPLQSVIDSALDQNWGNTATRVVTARVPAGIKIYEGAAAAQRGLVGGGNQIYIPKVNPNWIQ